MEFLLDFQTHLALNLGIFQASLRINAHIISDNKVNELFIILSISRFVSQRKDGLPRSI
jgi:hypothetical protein